MKPGTLIQYARRLDPVLRWLASHPDADPDLYAASLPIMEHPELTGRVIAALAGGPAGVKREKTGRALIGAEAAILIPTGVATTLLGAIVLVLMARRLRDAGPTREPPRVRFGVRSRLRFRVTLAVVVCGVAGVLLLGLLAGHTWLLTGDIALWLQGQAAPPIAFALDERAPRIVAAVVAVADFNQDGLADIVTANQRTNDVSVALRVS